MATERQEAWEGAWAAYQNDLTQIYSRDIQALIETPDPTEVENPEEPVERALESSGRLAEAIGERVDGADPEDRQLAIMQLAAAADVDAGVAADLARREEESEIQGLIAQTREVSLSFALPEAGMVLSARTLEEVPDLPEPESGTRAQVETVENAIEETIAKIRDDAAGAGKDVVAGIIEIKVPLGNALGAAVKGLIGALGEKVGFFIGKAVRFLARAVEKLLRLLGTKVTDAIADKLRDLLKDLEEGDLLADVLKRIWGTAAIEAEAKKKVTDAGAKLSEERAGAAVEKLNQLAGAHKKQTEIIRKVLKAVGVVGGLVAAVDGGALVLGGGYAAVLAFLTLSGADYVDWQRTDIDGFFDRVDGVRHIVDDAVA